MNPHEMNPNEYFCAFYILFIEIISPSLMQDTAKQLVICVRLRRKTKKKKKVGDAGDRTRGLSHAKRTLYH